MKRLVLLSWLFVMFVMSCKKKGEPVDRPMEVKQLNFAKAWGNAFGGTNMEVSAFMTNTLDGGYVLLGHTYSNDGDITGFKGLTDVWIVKADANGNKVWQKTIGGSKEEHGLSVISNPDGSFMGVGFTKSNDGDMNENKGSADALLFKLDMNGNLLWLKTFGGTADDFASVIVRNSDGTFVISGSTRSNANGTTDSNFWIFKVDGNGNMIWQKTYGGSGEDQINCITASDDGGYVLAGTTTSNDGDITGFHTGPGSSDVWVVKLDNMGNKVWTTTIGGSNGDAVHGVAKSNDGGYVLAGRTMSNDGDMSGNHGSIDGYVLKLNGLGKIVWQKSFGGTNDDWAKTIVPCIDGGYLIGVCSKSIDGDFTNTLGSQDVWIVKVDEDGNDMGKQIVGGSAHDEISAITVTPAGNYAFAGASQSVDGDINGHHGSVLTDFWLLKFNDQ